MQQKNSSYNNNRIYENIANCRSQQYLSSLAERHKERTQRRAEHKRWHGLSKGVLNWRGAQSVLIRIVHS